MRKMILCIAMAVATILLSACSGAASVVSPQDEPSAPEFVTETPEPVTPSPTPAVISDESADNPYFFYVDADTDNNREPYVAVASFGDHLCQFTFLNILELKRFENGILYQCKLDPVESVPDDRLTLGFFYVQKDRIYDVRIAEEEFDLLQTEADVLERGTVVCQDEERPDSLEKKEKGWHEYVSVNGDMREFHSYSNVGNTGWYRSFIWQEGRGIVRYWSGYGAEKKGVQLFRL